MKRLISWLLALTLICGLLPMSVFAAETDIEIGGDNADIETDFSALSPIDLTNDLVIEGDFSATVTVPAKTERFYQASRVAGMFMTINDGEAVACTGDNWTPYTWSIVNATDAEATYTIKVAFPVGHQMNPEVIEELAWSYFTVEQAAGDNDGYFYSYTAPADGTVTLYFTETPCPVYEAPTTDEGGNEVPAKWHADIAVTNNNTYANKSLQYDGVDNYGWELTVDVNAGDELIINTSYFADAEGNMYPAGTYTWCGNFQYPAGSQQNPTEIYVELDNAGAAEVTVTVPAGEHAYYVIYGANGTTLAVNGEGATEITMFNNAVDFDNTEGTEDATYVLSFSTPVGAYMNPEVIEDMNDYEDTGATVEGSPYYYIWTAPADGTVTLDVTDGANITVNNQNTYAQYVLAEVSYDDNMNFGGWTVADNLVIEVAEGDVLKIEVAGYSNDNAWDVPAVEYTLTGDFQAAEEPVVLPAVSLEALGLSAEAEVVLQPKFKIPAEFFADENAKVVASKTVKWIASKGGTQVYVTEWSSADVFAIGTDKNGRYVLDIGLASSEMTAEVVIEFIDGNGNVYPLYDYNSGETNNSVTRTAVDWAKLALTKGNANQKQLATALLVYGGYGQVYLGADIDNPAYNALTELGLAIPDISYISAQTLIDDPALETELVYTGNNVGAYLSKQTAGLDSKIWLRPYLYLESGYKIEDFTITNECIDENDNFVVVSSEVEYDASRNRYGVYIRNIAAKHMDTRFTVTVTNNSTGEVYTMTTSMMSWVRSCLEASTNADQLNLARAMYYYNQSANILFAN